jgi:hypothetical protein
MAGVVASRSLFQSRLLLPALVALCGPLVYVYHEMSAFDTHAFSLRRLFGMSVVLVLAANLVYQGLNTHSLRPLSVLVGSETRQGYLARNLQAHYAAIELTNEVVPQEGRVLFLWEPRSYYCRVPAQPDAILDRWAWLLHRHAGNLAAIAGELQQEGYTHVLYHRAGAEFVRRASLDPLQEEDWAALDAFLKRYLEKEGGAGEAYVLYRILPAMGGDR